MRIDKKHMVYSGWLAMLLAQLLVPFVLGAQTQPATAPVKIEANASLSPKEIKIGEWVQMKVEVKYPKGIELFWPEWQESIQVDSARSVDIIKQSKTDTLTANGIVTQTRTLTITAFDSGSYTIPPLVFSYRQGKTDSLFEASTLPMLLTVNTVAVDTTKAIRAEKPPLDLPFIWSEVKNYLIGGGIVLAIIIAIVVYFVTRKKPQKAQVVQEVKIPAHILAIQKLQALDDQKLWQQGNVKKYYSEISDIVREYIEKRFRILALESTTYELVIKLNNTNINRLDKANLEELLELADLAKFAKVEPLPDEHMKAMQIAREFVKNTMIPEKPEETQGTNE